MAKNQNATKTVKWPEIIAFTQEGLRRARLRTAQLEALLAVFRASQEAGDLTPDDLVIAARQARKEAKPLLKHRTSL